MVRRRLNPDVQRQWDAVRGELNRLAEAFELPAYGGKDMRTIALAVALIAGYATASLLAAPQDQGGKANIERRTAIAIRANQDGRLRR